MTRQEPLPPARGGAPACASRKEAGAVLPPRPFGVILADPPWRFVTWSAKGEGRSPQRHYRTMTVDEIKAMPVAASAGRDCALFLWTTWPHLPLGLEVIAAWGFQYSGSGFVWFKTWPRGERLPADARGFAIGGGKTSRKNTEPCLLAFRGHPRRLNADVREVIIAPRREHSRKPDCAYESIERLYRGPYLELFSRTDRRGWTSWGDQAGKFGSAG